MSQTFIVNQSVPFRGLLGEDLGMRNPEQEEIPKEIYEEWFY